MPEVKAEFWVMRVVIHPNRARKYLVRDREGLTAVVRTPDYMVEPDIVQAIAHVQSETYVYLPALGVLEPVGDAMDSNVKATAKAIEMAKRYPNETFVTVLNADPEELVKDPGADGAMTS